MKGKARKEQPKQSSRTADVPAAASSPKTKRAESGTAGQDASHGYDFEEQHIQTRNREDVIEMGSRTRSLHYEIERIAVSHRDEAVRREAGRLLADLTDSLQQQFPRMHQKCPGFRERWKKELHVQGRAQPIEWYKESCRRIQEVQAELEVLLCTEVWNLVSPPQDHRKPIKFPIDPALRQFLAGVRDWPALRRQAARLNRPLPLKGRVKKAGFLESLLKGIPLPPLRRTETKDEFVCRLEREIQREIAGPRFQQYWLVVIKARARAIYQQYWKALPPDKRSKAPYPAHALRPLKEQLLASLQRAS